MFTLEKSCEIDVKLYFCVGIRHFLCPILLGTTAVLSY